MPNRTTSILLGGVVAGIIVPLVSSIPTAGGCIACLIYLGAGTLATWHYTNTNELTITGGAGAGMGALAGIVSAIVGGLIGQLLIAIGVLPDFTEALTQAYQQGQMEQEAYDMMMGIFEAPWFWAAATVLGIIIGAILGSIGGAIGASVFKKGGDNVSM